MVVVHIFVSICGITFIKQHAKSGSVCVCMAWSGNIQGHKLGYIVVKKVQQDATIAFLFSAMALLYMFRVTISPIIRSKYAVYGHR